MLSASITSTGASAISSSPTTKKGKEEEELWWCHSINQQVITFPLLHVALIISLAVPYWSNSLNRNISERLKDPSDTLRKRKKMPSSKLKFWRMNNQSRKDQNFNEPLFTGNFLWLLFYFRQFCLLFPFVFEERLLPVCVNLQASQMIYAMSLKRTM